MADLDRHWGKEVPEELLPWTVPQARRKWRGAKGQRFSTLLGQYNLKSYKSLSCTPDQNNQTLLKSSPAVCHTLLAAQHHRWTRHPMSFDAPSWHHRHAYCQMSRGMGMWKTVNSHCILNRKSLTYLRLSGAELFSHLFALATRSPLLSGAKCEFLCGRFKLQRSKNIGSYWPTHMSNAFHLYLQQTFMEFLLCVWDMLFLLSLVGKTDI